MKYKLYPPKLYVFGSSVLTHSLPLNGTQLPQRFWVKTWPEKKKETPWARYMFWETMFLSEHVHYRLPSCPIKTWGLTNHISISHGELIVKHGEMSHVSVETSPLNNQLCPANIVQNFRILLALLSLPSGSQFHILVKFLVANLVDCGSLGKWLG